MIFSISLNKDEFFGYVVDWCEGGDWTSKKFDTQEQADEYIKSIVEQEL